MNHKLLLVTIITSINVSYTFNVNEYDWGTLVDNRFVTGLSKILLCEAKRLLVDYSGLDNVLQKVYDVGKNMITSTKDFESETTGHRYHPPTTVQAAILDCMAKGGHLYEILDEDSHKEIVKAKINKLGVQVDMTKFEFTHSRSSLPSSIGGNKVTAMTGPDPCTLYIPTNYTFISVPCTATATSVCVYGTRANSKQLTARQIVETYERLKTLLENLKSDTRELPEILSSSLDGVDQIDIPHENILDNLETFANQTLEPSHLHSSVVEVLEDVYRRLSHLNNRLNKSTSNLPMLLHSSCPPTTVCTIPYLDDSPPRYALTPTHRTENGIVLDYSDLTNCTTGDRTLNLALNQTVLGKGYYLIETQENTSYVTGDEEPIYWIDSLESYSTCSAQKACDWYISPSAYLGNTPNGTVYSSPEKLVITDGTQNITVPHILTSKLHKGPLLSVDYGRNSIVKGPLSMLWAKDNEAHHIDIPTPVLNLTPLELNQHALTALTLVCSALIVPLCVCVSYVMYFHYKDQRSSHTDTLKAQPTELNTFLPIARPLPPKSLVTHDIHRPFTHTRTQTFPKRYPPLVLEEISDDD